MMRDCYSRRIFLRSVGCGGAAFAFAGCAESLAQRGTDKRPNILFFFPDQHRFDWLGLNPDLPARTPNLDALAGRGVRFANAFCPSPVCAPSRACLAAGREYDRCGVASNGQNYPVEQITFYTLLRESGYHVTGCGKFDLAKPAKSWGRDGKQTAGDRDNFKLWGFSDGIDNGGKHDGVGAYRRKTVGPYMAFLEGRNLATVHVNDFAGRHNYKGTEPTALPDDAYVDNWIAQNGLELIGQAPKGKPWFLQINFNGPHEPMDITKRMKDRWKGVEFPPPNGSANIGIEKHNEIRQNYSAMIENIDRWLGVYIEELKKRGEYDNTLIVYSSDHGEMLGDKSRWGKSVPWQPAIGVPLVISGPGVSRGKVYEDPATTMDLAATFLDWAGLPVPAQMDSRSLKPLLKGKTDEHRKIVRSGLGSWRLVFDGRYKLIKYSGGQAKRKSNKNKADEKPSKGKLLLFDLKQDPLENNDLAEKLPQIVRRLAKILES